MTNSRSIRRIIYTHGGGRLGNQILRWAHWLSWVWDHSDEVEVVNVAFWPYASLFVGSYAHPGCVAPTHRTVADVGARVRSVLSVSRSRRIEGRLYPWLHSIASIWPGVQSIALNDLSGESIDLDGDHFLKQIADHSTTLCSGWKIAGWSRLKSHQARLRHYFQPTLARGGRARNVVDDLRMESDEVVGVLIRQTDYRDWHDGRFLFTSADYARWMRQLVELKRDRRVTFLVAADEWQDPAMFEGIRFRFASGAINLGGSAFDSWTELALCDAILGPPSTFAATAAFAGGIPLRPVFDRSQELRLEELFEDSLLDAAVHPIYSLSVK